MRLESPVKPPLDDAPSGAEPIESTDSTPRDPDTIFPKEVFGSNRSSSDLTAIIAGALAAALGVAVLICWHTGNLQLIEAHPGSSPMGYNTAISFLGLGLAVLALGLGSPVWARVTSAAVGLLGFARLVEYLAAAPFGTDKLLVRLTLHGKSLPDVPMPPNTAIGFVLLASAVLLLSGHRKVRWRSVATAFSGSVGFALGLNAFAGYLTALHTFGWGPLQPMAIHTSAGLMLLGAAVLTLSWLNQCSNETNLPSWILTVVTVAGIVTSVSFWQALVFTERARVESAIHSPSPMPETILIAGLLMTALLSTTVYLAQMASFRTRLAERASAELKETMNDLEAERRRFDDVLNMLPAYVVLLTPDYHVPFANRFFRERFGESHGRRCFEYLFGRSEPCEICETYCVLKTLAPHHWEWLGPDQHYYDIYDFPFTEADGSTLILEMGIDITERKQAEQKLQRASAYNRSLLEASLDPLITIAPDGKITDVNRATEQVTGVSRGELIGTDFSDYFTEPDKARQGYQHVFREGLVRDYELDIQHRNGHTTPVLYNASVYRDEGGAATGVFAAARDITARKQAEQAREESEEAFRTLAESVPQLVWMCNPDGLNIYFNQRWVEYTGLALQESYGTGWNTPFHPDDQQPAWNAWNHAVESGGTYRIECRLRGADGAYRWFLTKGLPLRDTTGKIVKWFGTCTDIDDLKRAQEELRFSQERLTLALKAGHSGTFDWDIRNNVNLWTPEVEAVYGIAPGKFGGTYEDWESLVLPEDLGHARSCLMESLKTGEFASEWRIRRRSDAEIRWIAARATVLFDRDGQPYRMIGINTDITERKRAEEALEQKAQELARSNADLEQFAYVASHDLQEPLRMVANFTQLLSNRYRAQVGQEGAEFIAYAVDGATRMQRLIEDLLTYSRVGTRGKSFEPADCNEALGQAVANLQVAIRESGAFVSHDDLPTIMADPAQLAQLFQNLVGNAIKFRGQAPPRVHVSAARSGAEWVFSVRDNGIGIDPKFSDRIFVIFQRLHNRGEYPGTGIGLALCKKIVERHRGKIWVDSEPGNGATFSFTIPAV